jgi:hypothetical protein
MNRQPTRRHLFLVARDLGHLSPKTSAGSYIHFFDWLLRIALDRSEFLRPSATLVAKASRRSPSTLSRWAAEFPGSMSVPIGIWYSTFPELKPETSTHESAIPAYESWPSAQAISPHTCDSEWKMLHRCARENAWDELNPTDRARVKKFREKLDYIFWLKLGTGRRGIEGKKLYRTKGIEIRSSL